MNRIEEIKKEVKKYFMHESHSFDHVERVYRLAIKIAEKENVNIELVKVATLLHDISRTNELNGKEECHALKGSEMAKPILEKYGYSREQTKIITDAIRTHRYKNQLQPTSKVGEILQDADRLDILGAIGIARVFTRVGEHKGTMYDPNIPQDELYQSRVTTGINHFHEKILKVTPDTFHTKTAKKLAKARYTFTKNFIETFLKEWEGKI